MKKIFFLCCVLFLTSEKSALAMDVTKWENLAKVSKFAYVIGVLEGWFFWDDLTMYAVTEELAKALSPTEQLRHEIVTCMKGRKTDQALAVVQRYVTENPKEWHKSMTSMIYNALGDACKKRIENRETQIEGAATSPLAARSGNRQGKC